MLKYEGPTTNLKMSIAPKKAPTNHKEDRNDMTVPFADGGGGVVDAKDNKGANSVEKCCVDSEATA